MSKDYYGKDLQDRTWKCSYCGADVSTAVSECPHCGTQKGKS